MTKPIAKPVEIQGTKKKKKGGKPQKQTRQQIVKSKWAKHADIGFVFDYWCTTVRKGQKTLILDYTRQFKIGSALHDYGMQTCLDAILGITRSEWHMGQNPLGKKYNDIALIFRDAGNVEKFAALGSEKSAREVFLGDRRHEEGGAGDSPTRAACARRHATGADPS